MRFFFLFSLFLVFRTLVFFCWFASAHTQTNKQTNTGLLCDLLWSDPDENINGWDENDRGVSFVFGSDVVEKFLEKHDLDLVCRAHQVIPFSLILLFFLFLCLVVVAAAAVDVANLMCVLVSLFPGGGGRVPVLWAAEIGDHLLCSQLLQRVRQRRRDDERR